MNQRESRTFLGYIRGEGKERLPSYSALRRNAVAVAGVLAVAGLAYVLGRSPPRHSRIVYKEQKVQVPIVEAMGYDPLHFSRLELVAQGRKPVTFHPGTAVKKWDGAKYSERSRQTTEVYAPQSIAETTLSLFFPQLPQQVLIAGKDYSTHVRKTAGGYKLTVPLAKAIPAPNLSATGKGTVTSEGLEALIYYKSPDSANVTKENVPGKAPGHLEDAERYLIQLVGL